MPMLPQIFSISGLAVELGVDRRTVAAKLRNVRPDGNLPGGSPGWRLSTYLRQLNGPTAGVSTSAESDFIADLLEDRLARPGVATKGDRVIVTIAEAAQMLGVDCETAMLWLRVGAPYHSAGDWQNGTGFLIDVSRLIDWLLLTAAHLAHIHRPDLHEKLRLPGS